MSPCRILTLIGSLLLISTITAQTFLPVDQALRLSFYSDGDTLVIDWEIEPEHYMYREMTSIRLAPSTPESVQLGELSLSNHDIELFDPTFEQVMPVFYDFLNARIQIHSSEPVALHVTYQGCAEAGLCYPPQTRLVTFDPEGVITGSGVTLAWDGASLNNPSQAATSWFSAGGLTERLLMDQKGFTIALFFVLGLGLVFTPCVLPMIPIMSTLVMGEPRPSQGRALSVALAYVTAMALTYASAGVLAASLGAAGNLQAILQQPWLLSAFAVLFVLLGFAMLGVFNLQTPSVFTQSIYRIQDRIRQGSLGAAATIGSLSALVVSPCVTAPLAGALLYVSVTGDLVTGFSALLALGFGMGTPLLLVAVGGARWLPKTGPWMNEVKILFAVVLWGVAIWLVSRWLPAPLSLALWGLLALGYASWLLGIWQRPWERPGALTLAIAMGLISYSFLAGWGVSQGHQNALRPWEAPLPEAPFIKVSTLDQLQSEQRLAAALGQPLMLDFSAQWCISCQIMERRIFAQPDVQSALANYRWVQLDVTAFTPEHQALFDQFQLIGPPAVLFFDNNGQQQPHRTIYGEVNKRQFMERVGI